MPDPTSPRTTPMWVKVVGAVIIVVLLGFIVTLLACSTGQACSPSSR